MSDERKQRILTTAEKLFSHYGAAKTTVADIARACNIAVGSVYLDFSSKQAILAALSQEKARHVTGRIEHALRNVQPPRERLVTLLVVRVEALLELAEVGEHGCDLVRCSAESPRAEQLTVPGFGQEVRALLRGELERAREAHAFAGEVEVAIATLELAFAALSPPLLFRLDRDKAMASARALSTLLVCGLAAPLQEGIPGGVGTRR